MYVCVLVCLCVFVLSVFGVCIFGVYVLFVFICLGKCFGVWICLMCVFWCVCCLV